MKINRTFCLDVGVVHELKKKSNQSFLVNKLLKQHLFGDYEYPRINECSTLQVAKALRNRVDDETLKAVLNAFISSNLDAKP
jgi:hypothetical protein